MRRLRFVVVILALAAFGAAFAPAALAATFTATNTADLSDTAPGDGKCLTTAGDCALRAAIQESNALGGSNTIRLVPAGVYQVNTWAFWPRYYYAGRCLPNDGSFPYELETLPGLEITSNTRLVVGSGSVTTPTRAPEPPPAVVEPSQPSDPNYPAFDCGAQSSIFIVDAGAHAAFDDVTITKAQVNHLASGDESVVPFLEGGGILNVGTLTLKHTRVTQNYASEGGGGITNGGTLTLIDSSVDHNRAAWGGGIENWATMTIKQSVIADNAALSGGGVDNRPPTLWAGSPGPAIGHYLSQYTSAVLAVAQSTISNNIATTGAGLNSTGAGGLPSNTEALTLTDSTVNGNLANADGGGIRVEAGAFAGNNDTIAFNTADRYGTGAGNGGGVSIAGGTFGLMNSIVADNKGPTIYRDCSGLVSSLGYNLIREPRGCPITGNTTGNILFTDPMLGSLQDNGGPTATDALLVSTKKRLSRTVVVRSPAIDAGSPGGKNACAATDQRGIKRPVGRRCDIGAFEYAPPPTSR